MSETKVSDRLIYTAPDVHQSPPSSHDINRARQAAEALFAPKRSIGDDTRPKSTGRAQQDQRKPRILSAVREQQPAARVEATKRPLQRETRTPRKQVPASHLERLRTWVKYGMTIPQAADVYGVSQSEIERIMQKA
jgi:hypothetical protein